MATDHLRNSPKIQNLSKETVRKYGEVSTQTARKNIFRKKFIPSLAVLAVLLILLLVKPWHIEIQTDREAVASQNRLVIIDFENLSDANDHDRFGRIISSLLTADLSGSGYIQIVPNRQILDIANTLGLDNTTVSLQNNANKIAERARANWLITGSIIRDDSGLAIISQLIELSSGNMLSAQKTLGSTESDLFAMIDQLSIQIKRELSLPDAAYEEDDLPVSAVSTGSADAYRHYIEGVEQYYRLFYSRAKESFNKALAYDSTFAMAYYWLSRLQSGPAIHEMIEKAKLYSNKATHLEQCYIKAYNAYLNQDDSLYILTLNEITDRYPDEKEAFLALGTFYYETMNYAEALMNLDHIVNIDPTNKSAHNLLAYLFMETGDYMDAFSEADKYLALSPDEPNPYDTKGDLYALNGQIDKAIESYQNAYVKDSNFFSSLMKLGNLYLQKGLLTKAETIYQNILLSDSSFAYSTQARLYTACVPIYEGDFERALKIIDSNYMAIKNSDKTWKTAIVLSQFHRLKANIYAEQKNFDMAISEIELTLEFYVRIDPGDSLTYRTDQAILLARAGRFAEAENIMACLKNYLAGHGCSMLPYFYGEGNIELLKNNTGEAIALLNQAADVSNIYRDYSTFFSLAKTYLKSGRTEKAVEEFERLALIFSDSRVQDCIDNIKLHYYLGLAYEELNSNAKAIEQYDRFLSFWGNSDFAGNEILDAKSRMEKLKRNSL